MDICLQMRPFSFLLSKHAFLNMLGSFLQHLNFIAVPQASLPVLCLTSMQLKKSWIFVCLFVFLLSSILLLQASTEVYSLSALGFFFNQNNFFLEPPCESIHKFLATKLRTPRGGLDFPSTIRSASCHL